MSTFPLALWKEPQPSGALTVVQPAKPQVQNVASQQFPYFFAPERFITTHSLQESLHFCAKYFAYTQREVAIAQISMDDAFVLAIDGQRFSLTEKANSDLCSILDIPLAFELSIPTDLTALIVRRLKALHTQSVMMITREDEDTIVSLVDPMKWAYGRGKNAHERTKKKPHYLPVPNLALLHMLEKVWSGEDVDTRVILTDEGMQVEYLHNAAPFTVEPMVGDVTRVGVAITNSETGGPLPVARGYTLRLRCTNGATVPTDTKLSRFSNDWRCGWQWRFDKFAEALRFLMQEMQIKCAALQMAYSRMLEAKLDDVQFHTWYAKAQYLYRSMATRSEHIDRIFGVDPDERHAFLTRERKWQKAKRTVTTGGIAPPQLTTLIAWEVFNGITAAARDEIHYYRRIGLESLAADVVSAFMPFLN
jgi:hypothetical protein